jgi:tetratricopeptide (TPR) repeat protein
MKHGVPRAFLSHSSGDKQFVSSVASRLGRHRVVFDAMHFDSGQTFVNEIEKYIKTSEVFIFFASPRSLASFWCTFEIDVARLAMIQKVLRRSITYVISNTVSLTELPEWLRESKVLFQASVGQVVRDIDHHLMSLLPPELKPPFVGRNAQKAQFLQELVDTRKRQVFVVSGLEAIGRRTYIKNVLEENLALRPGPTLHFDQLVGNEELYAQLVTDAHSFDAQGLNAELRAFTSLSPDQQQDEIVAKLAAATGANEYPVFIDHGGLTDKQGTFYESYHRLLDRFLSRGERVPYLALIHRGKPRLEDLSIADACLYQSVPPLTKAESVGLLRRLLSGSEKPIDEPELQRCAELAEGYPPALYFVARFVQKYGLQTLFHSPDNVAALKRRVFVKFLKDLSLDPVSVKVLRYLAREGPLQFGVIAAALEVSERQLADSLLKLIDLSLLVYEPPHYSISWPIRDSVTRLWGELPSTEYERIAHNIRDWTERNHEIPDIDTIDALLSAQVRGGIELDWSDTGVPVLPSTTVKLAERCYHLREYEQAYELSLRAEQYAKTRPQRLRALGVRAKALVNMQRWGEAEAVLNTLDKEVARERFHLRGFLLRRRSRFSEALEQYDKAIHTGHNPNSVLRDSADCLFRLGRFQEAIQRINIVRERDRDNPWVLDLLARCYTDANDDIGFEDALKDLKASDRDGKFWKHREAVFLAKRGKYERAMELVESACGAPGAPFESFALRADIAIERRIFPLARTMLEEIQRKFRNSRTDVQNGLWCKYFLAQGKWQEAESFSEKLREKDLPVHRALRLRILEAKIRDAALPLKDRQAAQVQAEQMKQEGGFASTILAEDIVLLPDDQEQDA